MNNIHVVSKPSVRTEQGNDINMTLLSDLLRNVAPLYPDFDVWFNFTFRRNLASGERRILIVHNGDELLGCSLLKNTPDEAKICTFYIHEEAREQGIGQQLMQQSLASLDNRETIITVSDDRQAELHPLLKSFDFRLTQVLTECYRQQHNEFVYSL